jgi:mono/diheme cytochrome c family protein
MRHWTLRIFGGLLLVLVAAVGSIYVISSRIINARHPFREHPLLVLSDSASVAHGERLTRIRCVGCHGDSLRGKVFFDEPNIARLVAPDVPAKLATLTDAEFAGFLRSGVRKDGTSPFVMPPPGFYHISDYDLGALIAYLRSLPVETDSLPSNTYRLIGRLGVILGQFRTSVTEFDTTTERVGDDPFWSTTRQGEYLARMICTECHGLRLTGDSAAAGGSASTPSLAGAAGYSPEEFVTLLRTGTPRESTTRLALMAETARRSLTHFTDDEIAAIYGYLQSLPLSGVAK